VVTYCRLVAELLKWWSRNKRDFPWRRTRDPYKVLIAAVLLRRTNAAKVEPVYTRLIREFPDLHSLSEASVDYLAELLKPLGLHNLRARELREIACELLTKYGSRIPDELEDLSKIRGIGTYIASAVACFAYGKPIPVIDSLVARVVSRLFNIRTPHHSVEDIFKYVSKLLECGDAKKVNLALIDLAALVCLPKRPKCRKCPLRAYCLTGSSSS